MTEYQTPPNTREAKELWAYLSEDKDGKRGVISGILPMIGAAPLVSLEKRVIDLMEPIALDAARATGLKVVLARFRLDEITQLNSRDRG